MCVGEVPVIPMNLNLCADPENFPDPMLIFRNFTENLIILDIFQEGVFELPDSPLDPPLIEPQVLFIW